jgi:hypothetical protein
MTGKWDRPDVPKHGWVCVGIDDLEEPSAICEMCETQEIRYVHTMKHRHYPDTLDCGCICAGQMEGNIGAARERETAVRNRAGRKARWLKRRWRISERGNAFIKADGYLMVVYRRGDHWGFRIQNTDTDDGFMSRRPLDSEDAAKLRAFDAMCWMQDHGR